VTTANREKLEEQLLELLYGDLPDADVAVLEAQLAEHPDLRARLDQWHEVRRVMAEMPLAEPDPQVRYDLLRAARKAVAEPERRGWWAWLEVLSTAPAVAGLALAVIAGSVLFTVTGDFSDHSPESAGEARSSAPFPSPTKARGMDAATARAFTLGSKEEAFEPAPSVAEDRPPPPSGALDLLAAMDDENAATTLNGAPLPKKVAARSSDKPVSRARPKAKKSSKAKGVFAKKRAPRKKRSAPRKAYRGGLVQEDLPPMPKSRSLKAPASAPPVVSQRASERRNQAPDRFAPPPAQQTSRTSSAGALNQRIPPSESALVDDDAEPVVERSTRMRRDAPKPAPGPEDTPQEAEVAEDDIGAIAQSPSSTSSIGSAGAAESNSRGGGRSRSEEAESAGAKEAEPAADSTSQLAQILDRARAAKRRGAHRVAVREYETYLKKSPTRTRLNEVWFEAAQSYEALGDLRRARQLYRLVARSRSGKSAAAQIRVDEIERRLDTGSPPPPEEPLGRPNMGL